VLKSELDRWNLVGVADRALALSVSYHGSGNAPTRGKVMDKIVIWDVPTRLIHWLPFILVIATYMTWRLDWMFWPAYAGIALLTLVVFRLL
jgi:hypothetical protein